MPAGLSSADEGCPEPEGAAGTQGLFKPDVPHATHQALRGVLVCPGKTPVKGKQTSGMGSS